ncbi:MAG: type II toxin-antitoxin system antitoxin SocA domain-containing protein [Candidatus Paceibacterota bacterium]|jgi:transcriptional regulator with XRE-family HTH domain
MISKFIENQRKKRNLTQKFIADTLGISRPTYMQIEKGVRDLTIEEAKKLAAVFGFSLDNLLNSKETEKIIVKIGKTKKSVHRETVRISVPQEKVEKFKQVLIYILKKVGGKPNIGMTVLYKLLYFIDFDYYEKYEDQLMGLIYLKNQHGPTPLLFENLIKGMVKKGDLEILKSKFYQYPQTKYLVNPNLEPDLSVLNGREKEHIDWELNKLSDLTAAQFSELSHKDVPWITAEEGKPIDYESVFYRTRETSVRDYEKSEND